MQEGPVRERAEMDARPNFNVGLQRSMVIALVLGGLAFLLVAVLAAWLVANPLGRYTPAAVTPVLDEYFQAAEDKDVVAASQLFSSNGLRRISREDLAARFALADLYANYEELEIQSVHEVESDEPVALDTAQVRAVVRDAFGRRSQVAARLEHESDRWRILEIEVWRPRTGAP